VVTYNDTDKLTLWPNSSVRNRWIQSVQSSQVVAELALALSMLVEYGRNFGVVGVSPLEDSWSAKGNSNPSSSHMWCIHHNALRPSASNRKGSSGASRGGNGSGSGSGSAADSSTRRRQSVSKKQQYQCGRSNRSTRANVSYAGMD